MLPGVLFCKSGENRFVMEELLSDEEFHTLFKCQEMFYAHKGDFILLGLQLKPIETDVNNLMEISMPTIFSVSFSTRILFYSFIFCDACNFSQSSLFFHSIQCILSSWYFYFPFFYWKIIINRKKMLLLEILFEDWRMSRSQCEKKQ